MPALSRPLLLLLFSGAAIGAPIATPPKAAPPAAFNTGQPTYRVLVRRTADGIPHLRAQDAPSLGYGQGYVQAQDNLCTLAELFLTLRGERSLHFGAQARPATESTFGQPANLELDFFFRHVADEPTVEQYRRQVSPLLQQLVHGWTAGYNRLVRDWRQGRLPGAHQACQQQAWVREIDESDAWRRLLALSAAGGWSVFAEQIAGAQPPGAAGDVLRRATAALDPAAFFSPGRGRGLGSNGLAFGGQATGTRHGLLAGNPHWFLRGPDRFYQAHLSLPGTLDVAGAGILGVPLILIGYNAHLAWTHTTSTARRFGFYELSLAPGSATSYLYEGRVLPMTAHRITVPVQPVAPRFEASVTRTLYRSHAGPLVDLSGFSPALAWTRDKAFAIRDVSATHPRSFSPFLRWAAARSLDEFIRIQTEECSVPWNNTLAAARGDTRVWYADIGAVPHVTDAHAARCTTDLGRAFAPFAPGVPFLDGSRADCEWARDADSPVPGTFGASRMPSLLRQDYVANMNDSHWLSQPAEPLTGFDRIIGPEGAPVSLRTQLGHAMAQARLAGTDGHGGRRTDASSVQHLLLDSRSLSAERFKAQALALACAEPQVALSDDSLNGEHFEPPRRIAVQAACRQLAAWNNTGTRHARGAHLWDEFWARLRRIPAEQLYADAFDPRRPLSTPQALRPDARIPQALAAAVLRVQQSGYPLDAERGDTVFLRRGSERLPLYGGCEEHGYFTLACSAYRIEQGGYAVEGQRFNNSYLQVVAFTDAGVQPWTLLSHSQSDDPASPHHADASRRYSAGRWLRVPFTEAEITAARPPVALWLSE
ncbi:penicillin acylase family protein [Eleftheria terrae]|uniref:penicillin acylase family protein n=1 Tax=Eleftheria terrae TaxID=1597781 RepID=UPI00263A8CD4|nr:penicillin acylase family protein [Eleftheria terrae]WKB54626.1 penicillin acylase family protein [Eleftheria terrae]